MEMVSLRTNENNLIKLYKISGNQVEDIAEKMIERNLAVKYSLDPNLEIHMVPG